MPSAAAAAAVVCSTLGLHRGLAADSTDATSTSAQFNSTQLTPPAVWIPCAAAAACCCSCCCMQVGVAIASTPKDMVAAAADIIVLNGQGIKNLPWLFHVADRTHAILKQVGWGHPGGTGGELGSQRLTSRGVLGRWSGGRKGSRQRVS